MNKQINEQMNEGITSHPAPGGSPDQLGGGPPYLRCPTPHIFYSKNSKKAFKS